MSIGQYIRILAGTHEDPKVYLFDAEVVAAVDEKTRTVEVVMVGGKSSNTINARIMASVDDGCFIYPENGSTVSVIMSEFTDPIIIAYSSIEKITWLGGENDGVPLVKPLLDKINNLENEINNLKTLFSSWVVVPSDGGAALKAITATWSSQQITPTIQSDLEHTKIKQ